MKNDKTIIIFIVFICGWLAGHVHHYVAGQPAQVRTEAKVERLETALLEARADITKKVRVKATAYSNDPISIDVPRWRDQRTATNKFVRKGMVAADWRVFPPGTRLYIPGYGEAVVEDKGGAVKGMHLDLFLESRTEALKWGVKELDVYVISRALSGV
jgi:3D (Asp-Asp-Asp) domain-containing protein